MSRIIRICRDNRIAQRHYLKSLITARRRLAQYPLLNKIFKKFQSYEVEDYRNVRNTVFRRIMKFSTDDIELLSKLDRSLLHYSNEWTPTEYDEFCARLVSKKGFESYTAITEILTAFEMWSLFWTNSLGQMTIKLQ